MTNTPQKEGYCLVTIPFSGFYETHFGEYFDYDMEFQFASEAYPDKDDHELMDVVNAVADTIDHKATRLAIAKAYVDQFNSYYHTQLEFESLESPREYNFTTDTIYCYISHNEIRNIFEALDLKILDELIKDKFTSRDGFISFYSNDINEWNLSDLTSLDHNELSTILEAWLYTKHHTYGVNLAYACENDVLDRCLIHEKIVFEC